MRFYFVMTAADLFLDISYFEKRDQVSLFELIS